METYEAYFLARFLIVIFMTFLPILYAAKAIQKMLSRS